jgi:hypothetical protein
MKQSAIERTERKIMKQACTEVSKEIIEEKIEKML